MGKSRMLIPVKYADWVQLLLFLGSPRTGDNLYEFKATINQKLKTEPYQLPPPCEDICKAVSDGEIFTIFNLSNLYN